VSDTPGPPNPRPEPGLCPSDIGANTPGGPAASLLSNMDMVYRIEGRGISRMYRCGCMLALDLAVE
jgi:hypothetical protein